MSELEKFKKIFVEDEREKNIEDEFLDFLYEERTKLRNIRKMNEEVERKILFLGRLEDKEKQKILEIVRDIEKELSMVISDSIIKDVEVYSKKQS